MIVMTMFPAVASADAAAGSKVFFEEGGEEATYEDWNNRWPMRYDSNDDSSHDWWCRQMHEVHSGQRSIYCARNGYNSHYLDRSGGQPWNVNLTALPESVPQTNYVLRYDTDMDSIMRKEIVGARYYNKVTMTFWFYSDTGVSDAKQPGSGVTVGYDFLNAIYYTGMSDSIVKARCGPIVSKRRPRGLGSRSFLTFEHRHLGRFRVRLRDDRPGGRRC